MRGIEWCFDPDPGDTTYLVDYGLLLRQGTETRMVHDRHVEGLFARATWVALLREAGWEVEVAGRALGPDERGEMFVARRPLRAPG